MISHSSGDWESKIKVSAGPLLPGSQMAILSLRSHIAEGWGCNPGSGTNPTLSALLSWPNHLPWVLPTTYHYTGGSVSTYEFWRDTNIPSRAHQHIIEHTTFLVQSLQTFPYCPIDSILSPRTDTKLTPDYTNTFVLPSSYIFLKLVIKKVIILAIKNQTVELY